MFSSSSTEVGPLLVESVRTIRERNPLDYQALIETVGSLRVSLIVGDETLVIVFRDGQFRVHSGEAADVDAFVVTDSAAINRVVSGRSDLVTELFDGALRIRGPIDVLVRLHDGLQAYVRAVMTTPGHRRKVFA